MIKCKSISRLLLPFLTGIILLSCGRHYLADHHKYQQYSMDQKEVDSSLVRYYMPFKVKMEREMNRVIGTNEQELTKPSEPETLLGDFFADAILAESRKLDPTIDISFPTTKGGMRNPLAKGDVTIERMFELMPFENELVVLKMSGPGVKKLIDFIAGSQGQPIAGMRMKVKDKTAFDIVIGGKPFDINKEYTIITSDYLANSGDDQRALSNPLARRDLGKKVRDALIEHVEGLTKNNKTIKMSLDGRVIFE